MTKIAAITDGLSNTMMTSEIKIANPGTDLRGYTWWGPPRRSRPCSPRTATYQDTMGNGGCFDTLDAPCNTGVTNPAGARVMKVYLGARGYHPGGVNVGMCDGSVRFIKNSVSLQSYQALSTTAGWRGPQLRLVLIGTTDLGLVHKNRSMRCGCHSVRAATARPAART